MLPDSLQCVIKQLSELEEVVGLLCFGSYATGLADTRSDIDLLVLCSPAVPDADRRVSAIQRSGCTDVLVKSNEDSAFWPGNRPKETAMLGGRVLEFLWNELAWVKKIVDDVKSRSATTTEEMPFRPYTVLGLLEHSRILYDKGGVVLNLKNSLYPYPSGLKKKLIREGLSACDEALINVADYAERQIGNTGFHFHLQEYLNGLYTLLFAINEQYDPATKRFERHIESFKICPERFRERYEKALLGPFDMAGKRAIVAELKAFIDELRQKLRI